MKKKIFFGVATMFFAVATMFNMSLSMPNKAEDILLSNIETMQVSAGEIWCDQSNEVTCKIEFGGFVGTSIGFLRAIN